MTKKPLRQITELSDEENQYGGWRDDRLPSDKHPEAFGFVLGALDYNANMHFQTRREEYVKQIEPHMATLETLWNQHHSKDNALKLGQRHANAHQRAINMKPNAFAKKFGFEQEGAENAAKLNHHISKTLGIHSDVSDHLNQIARKVF